MQKQITTLENQILSFDKENSNKNISVTSTLKQKIDQLNLEKASWENERELLKREKINVEK